MARKKRGLTIEVQIESLEGDPRFSVLAEIGGFDVDAAWGKLMRLWAWCLKRQQFELHEAVIRQFLGPEGVRAILADGVDDLALGQRTEDGRIYVRGSRDNLGWLGAKRDQAAVAGAARAASAQRDESGAFVSEQTKQVHPAGEPLVNASSELTSGDQQQASESTSGIQPLPIPSPIPIPTTKEEELTDLARAYVPPAPAPAPGRDGRASRLASLIWNFAAVTQSKLVSEGLNGKAWAALPHPNLPGWKSLRERCLELVDMHDDVEARRIAEYRVEQAATEARAKRTLEFFIPLRMWHESSFEFATSTTPEQMTGSRAKPSSTSKRNINAIVESAFDDQEPS